MSWGYKIMLAYILFVAGIMLLVFKSSSRKQELVIEDYYEQELKFQQKIDEAERAQSLSAPVKYAVDHGKITVSFPGEMKGKRIDAQVWVYFAADQSRDKTFHLTTDDATLLIELPENSKGNYALKMDWKAGGTSYYAEHKVFIK